MCEVMHTHQMGQVVKSNLELHDRAMVARQLHILDILHVELFLANWASKNNWHVIVLCILKFLLNMYITSESTIRV